MSIPSIIPARKYPVYVSPNSIEIRYMLDAYEKVLGKKTTSTISNGIGYNAIFPNCVTPLLKPSVRIDVSNFNEPS